MTEKWKWMILCDNCAQRMMEDTPDFRVFLAMFGPQGSDDEDFSILVCVPWMQRVKGVASQPYPCDKCNQIVSVARSSGWFVDRHRKERV